MSTQTLADFDFDLPPELIAQHPTSERSASRLLDATTEPPIDRVFSELPSLLRPGDLLVANDTRVVKARLFGRKVGSGGAVEALLERVLPQHEVLAHMRSSKPLRPGTRVRFADAFEAEVLGRGGEVNPQSQGSSREIDRPASRTGAAPLQTRPNAEVVGAADSSASAAAASLFRLRFPEDPFALLERHGHVPLPPYITHADTAADEERYQTVFAQRPGAVAAPTAALHFDAGVLMALRQKGVEIAQITLHVGAGTFQPVRSQSISEHTMHREWYEVSPATVEAIERTRARGGSVVAVGTTSLRALESAALQSAAATRRAASRQR